MSQPPYNQNPGVPQPPYWPGPPPPSQQPVPPQNPFASGQPVFRPPDPQRPGSLPVGRDPRAPFGAAQPAQISIDDYAPPRPKAPLVIAIIVAVIALGVALFVVTQAVAPAPESSPTPQPVASATPSWGMQFMSEDGRQSGEWQIVSSDWTSDGLRVQVRVHVDRGPIQVVFFAYTNEATQATDPLPSSDFPGADGTTMSKGDDRTGWLVFPMTQSNVTIVLADYWTDQLSALPVSS